MMQLSVILTHNTLQIMKHDFLSLPWVDAFVTNSFQLLAKIYSLKTSKERECCANVNIL